MCSSKRATSKHAPATDGVFRSHEVCVFGFVRWSPKRLLMGYNDLGAKLAMLRMVKLLCTAECLRRALLGFP